MLDCVNSRRTFGCWAAKLVEQRAECVSAAQILWQWQRFVSGQTAKASSCQALWLEPPNARQSQNASEKDHHFVNPCHQACLLDLSLFGGVGVVPALA